MGFVNRFSEERDEANPLLYNGKEEQKMAEEGTRVKFLICPHLEFQRAVGTLLPVRARRGE